MGNHLSIEPSFSCPHNPTASMQISVVHRSSDGKTSKYLLDAGDALVECTHVNRVEKHIICFSTAVGCPIACRFCSAARFRRRLTGVEMAREVFAVVENSRLIGRSAKPLLFSAMGEGEPLLSDDAARQLVEAFSLMDDRFPGSRFAVSTTGIRPSSIEVLAQHAPSGLKLQISVHGPNDVLRSQIIPHASPLASVIAAAEEFERITRGSVEWNYVLIDGLNDSIDHASELAALLGRGRHVKLNRLNPISGLEWRPSPRAEQFAARLTSAGLKAEFYCTDGVDVSAACGQLRSTVLRRNRNVQHAVAAGELVVP